MLSKTPEYRREYWKRYRAVHRPYVEKQCADCGEPFKPDSGPQKRCNPCRKQTCETCGSTWLPTDGKLRRFCSLSCAGAREENVQRLASVRGKKPRTYASRRSKYGSAEDREWREAVFRRDDYTCQMCGARGGRLQADHIQPVSTHPELRHVLENGRTLCVECHRQTPTYGWRGYWLKRRRSEIAAKRLSQEVLDLGAA